MTTDMLTAAQFSVHICANGHRRGHNFVPISVPCRSNIMPKVFSLKRSMANSAWKSDKCYRVLTNLLKDGKSKFANESNMIKVFSKGYNINSLHEAGLQVGRTISVMTAFKKLIDSEKKRLETKDKVCITYNVYIILYT